MDTTRKEQLEQFIQVLGLGEFHNFLILDQALTEDDQVVALTRMIRAYEQGLAALRDGLRRAGIREQEIRADFDARGYFDATASILRCFSKRRRKLRQCAGGAVKLRLSPAQDQLASPPLKCTLVTLWPAVVNCRLNV